MYAKDILHTTLYSFLKIFFISVHFAFYSVSLKKKKIGFCQYKVIVLAFISYQETKLNKL